MHCSVLAVAALAVGAVATSGYDQAVEKTPVKVEKPKHNVTKPETTEHKPKPVPVYKTKVVTDYTTYCPAPTTIVHNKKTYTVTKATTLTITDCPCTVTYAETSTTPVYPVETHPVYSSVETHPVYTTPAPVYSTPAPVYPSPVYNSTTVVGVASPSVAPVETTPAAPVFTGAANKAFAASGAGLAGLVGLAAYIL